VLRGISKFFPNFLQKNLKIPVTWGAALVSVSGTPGRHRDRALAVSATTLKPLIVDAIAKDSHFRTDESGIYWNIGEQFASHRTVVHSLGEYVRGDAHTNTIEGYFSIFKRGIYGMYHHVSQQHLKRYLAEFDFRYNERIALGVSDADRAIKAIRGAAGKRLTYRQPRGAQPASA
jgi:hypothetical protein